MTTLGLGSSSTASGLSSPSPASTFPTAAGGYSFTVIAGIAAGVCGFTTTIFVVGIVSSGVGFAFVAGMGTLVLG